MAYFNVKMPEVKVKYDWDAIEVGNEELDHSENFFAYKHYEHERLEDMALLQEEMAKTELTDIEEQCVIYKIEKHDNTITGEEEQLEDKENINCSLNSSHNEETEREDLVTSPEDEATQNHNHDYTDNEQPESHLDKTVQQTHLAPKLNLVCQWSTQKPATKKCHTTAGSSKGAVSKNMPPPPQAYLVKDLYQKKREEAERRREEEERKRREFHSRPVPNFNAHHQLMEKRKPAHAFTVAVTPKVLKKSKEAEEKRRQRLEEWKQKNQPPKFESRPPTVLKEKPFVPEKKPLVIQQCPFKLHTEKRLAERKHYDEAKHKALEEKRKQEEEERKRREEERIRELRKAATFKARPNPFRH
ncbi:golgin subfamily A member 6-like protein 24 [Musca vetustissima]|uniref:golgin subfamily A member 6-like protein 24 n=2 Tax=Musca vetustissima TaxID=27455 RepID=UPI002AB6709A|nr:golgin subfamily A member 6-like protein 24 [Musca vetustissima]